MKALAKNGITSKFSNIKQVLVFRKGQRTRPALGVPARSRFSYEVNLCRPHGNQVTIGDDGSGPG